MNKAAAELPMTQPNLSRAMMNLEDELNIRIFTRGHHGRRPDGGRQTALSVHPDHLNQMELIEGIASREATPVLLHRLLSHDIDFQTCQPGVQ